MSAKDWRMLLDWLEALNGILEEHGTQDRVRDMRLAMYEEGLRGVGRIIADAQRLLGMSCHPMPDDDGIEVGHVWRNDAPKSLCICGAKVRGQVRGRPA